MGVVYEVEHPQLPGRRLALKQNLAPGEQETSIRFLREAELLAKVVHPNVVRVVSLDHAPSGPYLVTDLVEGQELADRAGVPTEPREAARLVRDLAGAVAAVHAQGILHRDLKPQNVIVRPDGTPVLLDFGVAREQSSERLTQTGAMIGTVQYMSPEQASGEPTNQLTARTDVYALGAILFFLLSGGPPFHGTGINVVTKLLTEDPPWPAVPGDLGAVLRQAMAKDRIARYPSAAALGEDLDRYLAGEPVSASPVRRGRPWALVVGGVLAAIALAAWGLRGDQADPAPAPLPSERTDRRPIAPSTTPTPTPTQAERIELVIPEKLPRSTHRLAACFLDDDTVLMWSAIEVAGHEDWKESERGGRLWCWKLSPSLRLEWGSGLPRGRPFLDALVKVSRGEVIVATETQLYRIRLGKAPVKLGGPFPHRVQSLALSSSGLLAVGLRVSGSSPVWTVDLRQDPPVRKQISIPGKGLKYPLLKVAFRGDDALLIGSAEGSIDPGSAGEFVTLKGEAVTYAQFAGEVRAATAVTGTPGAYVVGTSTPQVRFMQAGGDLHGVPLQRSKREDGAEPNKSLSGSARALCTTSTFLFAISGDYQATNELRVWRRTGSGYEHHAAIKRWGFFLSSIDVSPNGSRVVLGTQRAKRSQGRTRVEVWPTSLIRPGVQRRSDYPRERQ